MIRAYTHFAARNWDHLLFGAMLMAFSSFGQTYFVALSGVHFRATFGLSDGGLGALYAADTFASALTLPWAGRLIDHTSVRHFTCAAALLSAACCITALSSAAIMLALSFYLLRLGGQGLMVHTALTATARTFPADAGKALGIVALGFSAAQAVFPLPAVFLMETAGWRWGWAINAALLLLGVAVALHFLPREAEDPDAIRLRKKALAATASASLWRDPRLLLTMPSILAPPFIITGFFFHQARLAEEKGWRLSWIAGWFVAYAVVQACAQLAIGPLIDHFGPKRLLPFFLIPLALGMAALFLTNSIWAAPAYLILSGLSSAVASTLATSLWVDLYGAAMLARVRSTVESALVISSGAAPFLMGYLINWGVSLSTQALGCFLYVAVASGLAVFVARAGRITLPAIDGAHDERKMPTL
jgi:MFS family permease